MRADDRTEALRHAAVAQQGWGAVLLAFVRLWCVHLGYVSQQKRQRTSRLEGFFSGIRVETAGG